MAGELVSSVEGPRGKAEIYEHVLMVAGGGQRFEYEVQCQGTSQRFLSLGEAYVTAKELAGSGG